MWGFRMPAVSSLSPRVLCILGYDPDMANSSQYCLQGLNCNTYVVGTGRSRILINTGEPDFPEYVRILEETMKEHNFQIGHIIITHYHKGHLVGVKNVLDMIDSKYECKVWKFLRKEDNNREYEFPLNVLENNQMFRIDGATLKVYQMLGYKPDRIGITLEEERSLFTVGCEHGMGKKEYQGLDANRPFLKLAHDKKLTVLFSAHGPPDGKITAEVNNSIETGQEGKELLYSIINNSPHQKAAEKQVVNNMYEIMKLQIKNNPPTPITSHPTYKTLVGAHLKNFAAGFVHQHLLSLEKDGRLIRVGNVWRVANNKRKT